MNFPNVIAVAVPVFVAAILIEIAIVRLGGARFGRYGVRDSAASLLMGLGNRVTGLIGGTALMVAMLTLVYQFRLIDALPVTGWTVIICFVADDFAYYWFHRIAHERRWFWASHVVHHSSRHYNLTTALRQTWTGKFTFSFIFSLPLALIGFPPAMIVFVSGVNLIYQFWIHTETIDRLGPMEWIFNTPSHHRVHHATNPAYLDANYAGTLIIWDRIFGTFVPEVETIKPRYGIIRNLDSYNPLTIAFHEWISIWKDLKVAKSLREYAGYLFGPPGWSPDGSRLTSAAIKAQWIAEQNSTDQDDTVDTVPNTIDDPGTLFSKSS